MQKKLIDIGCRNNKEFITKNGNYHQNQRVTNISDFHTIEHNQQYSGSSRGYVGQDKSNYSLSPNHTKVPSNNSGYFMYAVSSTNQSYRVNNSSRNARRPGKLEHIKTDPTVFHSENQNSRNKYSGGMIEAGYHDQRNTYETGKVINLLQ